MSASHKIRQNLCLKCGAELDAVTCTTAFGLVKPAKDDLTICAYCATEMRFNADLSLRLMTDKDREELSPRNLRDLEKARMDSVANILAMRCSGLEVKDGQKGI